MDLSIIIVNYKTCRLTLQALESVYRSQTSFQFEVIMVDNHSADGSVEQIAERYPQMEVIANGDNLGFAKANNQGIKRAAGRYILLLNSDTVIQPDTLDVMIRFMDTHVGVGASGCKILLPDGSLDKACKRGFPTPLASFYYAFGLARLFPDNPRFNQYQLGFVDPNQEYPVDSLVGAFMMVRKETIDQVGLLDEAFFMYGEDIDWCYRMKKADWEAYYYPKTSIVHYKGASSRKKSFKIVYEFHRAMILFHRKHFRTKYSWMVNGLVYAGVAVKFLAAWLSNTLKRGGESVD